jgi:hypothetical protein
MAARVGPQTRRDRDLQSVVSEAGDPLVPCTVRDYAPDGTTECIVSDDAHALMRFVPSRTDYSRALESPVVSTAPRAS